MSRHFQTMPVDKSTIKTRLRFHRQLITDPDGFLRIYDLPIRNVRNVPGRQGDRTTTTLILDVLTYKGIKLTIRDLEDNPLAFVSIEFNPGVCLFGHNGIITQLNEFLYALALLRKCLTPLLAHPADSIDLIPGLRENGVAYWDYLEIPFQYPDPEARLLNAFRHLRHTSITTPSRHWPDSIEVGSKRGKMQLSMYRKAREMTNREKLPHDRLDDYIHILRLEARLRTEKLVDYLGNKHNQRNAEKIDGKDRLVRFYPGDLVRAHRAVFGDLQGVFACSQDCSEAGKVNSTPALGILLARVARDPRTSRSFPELLSLIRNFTGPPIATIATIRQNGVEELSRLSDISRDELFSDTAYDSQPGIGNRKIEERVQHRLEDTLPDALIAAAYCPTNQPFRPRVQIESYHQYQSESDHD